MRFSSPISLDLNHDQNGATGLDDSNRNGRAVAAALAAPVLEEAHVEPGTTFAPPPPPAQPKPEVPVNLDLIAEAELAQVNAGGGPLTCLVLVDGAGTVLAEASLRGSEAVKCAAIQGCLGELARNYPRQKMKRALFEDDAGIVAMAPLTSGRVAIMLAEPGTALGVVALAVSRVTARLAPVFGVAPDVAAPASEDEKPNITIQN
jgi:hypothetical protein